MGRTLLVELNEVNFDAVRYYAGRGELPVLASLIDRHGLNTTTSETEYEKLEPWIQWVTAHTGLTLAEHNIFRLGDIVEHDLPQIWERLEAEGKKVGAVSPMNARNRLRKPAFFVPDPWTRTDTSGSLLLRRLSSAVAQAVNDNASGRITSTSAGWLAAGLVRYARPRNYGAYARIVRNARRKPWQRAMLLDLLLHDVFVRLVKSQRPDFASLFLNSAAHIQHHYMFSSPAYSGFGKNPAWYVPAGEDPLLDVYRLYDRLVGDLMEACPDARLMIATGLHQEPHPGTVFYWRLRDHKRFLSKLDVPFVDVEPRMSRDFLVKCRDAGEAQAAQRRLESVRLGGLPVFEVDNRGDDLFVILSYPHDIESGAGLDLGNEAFPDFKGDIAFVAIKNGEHDGRGYFIDTQGASRNEEFPLAALPERVRDAVMA